jgi:hypothetical protein
LHDPLSPITLRLEAEFQHRALDNSATSIPRSARLLGTAHGISSLVSFGVLRYYVSTYITRKKKEASVDVGPA